MAASPSETKDLEMSDTKPEISENPLDSSVSKGESNSNKRSNPEVAKCAKKAFIFALTYTILGLIAGILVIFMVTYNSISYSILMFLFVCCFGVVAIVAAKQENPVVMLVGGILSIIVIMFMLSLFISSTIYLAAGASLHAAYHNKDATYRNVSNLEGTRYPYNHDQSFKFSGDLKLKDSAMYKSFTDKYPNDIPKVPDEDVWESDIRRMYSILLDRNMLCNLSSYSMAQLKRYPGDCWDDFPYDDHFRIHNWNTLDYAKRVYIGTVYTPAATLYNNYLGGFIAVAALLMLISIAAIVCAVFTAIFSMKAFTRRSG